MKDLRVKYVPIGDVRPYEDNPRRNDGAVQAVANSLREFGWKQPIVVDADGTIVVGHTRYKAALALGMTDVPVVVASDLTPEQCAAYRLADNRVGELAEWDGERRLGLRCVLSTVAGESIDMGIFTIAAFWGVLPAPVLVETFISGVVLKSLWETIVYALATRHVIAAVKAMPDE